MAEKKKRPGRPPNPNRIVKSPKYRMSDPQRPCMWKSGPDELRHEIYKAFLCRRAQANFREEGWTMNFEEFFDLWHKDWHNKGRLSHNVCMSRHDISKPWTRENSYIRSRYDQLLEQAQGRIGKGRVQMQKKLLGNKK